MGASWRSKPPGSAVVSCAIAASILRNSRRSRLPVMVVVGEHKSEANGPLLHIHLVSEWMHAPAA